MFAIKANHNAMYVTSLPLLKKYANLSDRKYYMHFESTSRYVTQGLFLQCRITVQSLNPVTQMSAKIEAGELTTDFTVNGPFGFATGRP